MKYFMIFFLIAETPDNRVVVCDAKINFDDNAEFRQAEVFKFRDRTQEDWREVEAAKYDLNYIGLSGNNFNYSIDINCYL